MTDTFFLKAPEVVLRSKFKDIHSHCAVARPIGPDHAPPAAPRYFNMRKTTIYGGSTEIQKNIVSKAILGL